LVRAGKDGGLVDGKSILMRGQGQNIEWAIRPAGMVMADEAALREDLAPCLHCSAPASKRTGKMCGVCNREALKVYKTAYKGPQYSESAPAPPEVFEVTGGMCSIKCPVCAALFMEAGPNDADVLASGPGTCDCGVKFDVYWDGGAYLTTAVPMPVEDPVPTFGRPVDDNTAAKFVEPAPSTKPVVEREIAKRVVTKDRVHPMLPSCRLLAKTEAHSDDWHAARASGIGSSDAGAILGLSPFATIQDVWATKVGQPTDRKPWLEPYAAFGTFFEPHLRHAIRVDGVNLVDGEDLGTLQSLTWERACANVDGLDATTGDNWEIKTSSEEWPEVPAAYYAQCQHQMFVTGADRTILHQYVCPVERRHIAPLLRHVETLALVDVEAENVVAAWLLEVGTRKNWIIEYDEEYAARLIEREREFWAFVENGEEPPVLESEGTVDLTDCDALVGYLDQFVLEAARIPSDAKKNADKLKKSARSALEEALALRGVRAKRITAGPHKATWVQPAGRSGHWTIYGGEDASINW
jgi:putative phage-type endonuclease